MRKEILATFCVLTIMASATPIFAASTTTPIVSTDSQLKKLTAIQTELTNLVVKIESLKTTYKIQSKEKDCWLHWTYLKNKQTNSTKQ